MSWQDRPYSTGNDFSGGYGFGGGARSWLGGLPSPGKAVKWIALANIGMFVLCQFTGRVESPVFQWLAMRTDLVLKGQIWRLFTFTYLHDQAGLMHIFFNMLGLYFLGLPLERHWGTKRFFVFYTLGGFVAVLLYFVVTTVGWLDPGVPLIGASGGVFAVMGACAVLFPQFRIILVLFPVPIRTAVLIFVVWFTFNLWNQGLNAGGDACHIAGLAFGIAWGYRGHVWTQKWHQRKEAIRRGAWEAKRREMQALEDDVDRILEKVNRQGVNSLTRREKRSLQAATKMQQEADRQHRL
ncbi:MAG: rhomboid family intramembrane serine protease [Phycisphaerae bacterium]|nr:rhomboid family intramembrane serine protease [Phycisphaerae bacterium]